MSNESVNCTLPELLGDPKADAAMLNEVSPLYNAAKLTVPVMLPARSRCVLARWAISSPK